jgi:hypothetical protein
VLGRVKAFPLVEGLGELQALYYTGLDQRKTK